MSQLTQVIAASRRRVTAFDPLSLSPVLWFDAADESTLFDAVSGGSLVANGGLVARWQDKSSTGNHAIQSLAEIRLVKNANQVNGLPALACSGSCNFLLSATTAAATAFTSFFVFTRASAGIHSLGLTNGAESYPAYWFSDNNIYFRPSGEGFQSVAGGTSTGTFVMTSRRSGTALSTRRNGVELASGTIAVTASSQFTTIGQRLGVSHNGDMCEIVHCNAALGSNEISACEEYLMNKWRN